MEVTNSTAASHSGLLDNPAPSNNLALANKETFLQLLVAQIKNQDPLKPMDGVQFLSQLAQFSELEQLIGIRQELTGAAQAPPVTPPATPPATTGTNP